MVTNAHAPVHKSQHGEDEEIHFGSPCHLSSSNHSCAAPKVNLEGASEVYVQKLQSAGWLDMRLVITRDVIAFQEARGAIGRHDDVIAPLIDTDRYDDVIPLVDIDCMELISDEASAGRGGGTAWSQNKQKCKIFTVGWEGKKGEEGYNLGRKYCISMDMTTS